MTNHIEFRSIRVADDIVVKTSDYVLPMFILNLHNSIATHTRHRVSNSVFIHCFHKDSGEPGAVVRVQPHKHE